MDLEKIAKNCQNLFRKIQNRKNGIFHRNSDILNSNFNIAFFDKNDRNTLFWSKADKNMKLGKNVFRIFDS